MAVHRRQFRGGIADTARQFGVTIKALRLYEDMGLVTPVRDGNRWRTYGQSECERLHLVLLLRQLGLSLSTIATLLKDGDSDMRRLLAAQEQALLREQRRLEDALRLIQDARARVETGEPLDIEELAQIARQTSLQTLRSSTDVAELVAQCFTREQARRLRDSGTSNGAHDDAEWEEIFREVARVSRSEKPNSPPAQSLARRAIQLIPRVVGDDIESWRALRNFWAKGVRSPAVARDLPLGKKQWQFLDEAIRLALIEHGR